MLISCPECCRWACTWNKLSRKLQAGATQLECRECEQIISIAGLAAGVVPLSSAELKLKQDLAIKECDPSALELMRCDVVRVLRNRLADSKGRSHPLLWALLRGRDGTEFVASVCEHPEGWHPVAGNQTHVTSPDLVKSFKSSEYWMLVAPAFAKLMPDEDIATAAGQLGARDPMCGSQLEQFLANVHERCVGGGGARALRPVNVKRGAPQWLCAEHALLHQNTSNSVQCVQWKCEQDNGELFSFDEASSTVVESAFKAGKSEVELAIGRFRYTILNLTSASPPPPGPPAHQAALMQLQEMGFPRSPVAEELLIKHSNKLEVVVNALLAHPEQGRCVQENQSTKKKRGVYRRVYDAPYPVLPPLSLDVPVPRLDQPFQLYDVPRSSLLWQRVCKRVLDSLPLFEVVKIEQVVNRFLWERYCAKAYDLVRNNGNANERELFHVSHGDLDFIIKGTNAAGLDPRLKNPGGCEYGNGVYFAACAAYCAAYLQGWLDEDMDPPAGEIQMLMALVSLGECKDFGPLCTSSRGNKFAQDQGVAPGLQDFWGVLPKKDQPAVHRNRPPPKNMSQQNSELYDSVCGTEADLAWSPNKMLKADGARLGKQYVVFEAAQSYPSLRITLKFSGVRGGGRRMMPEEEQQKTAAGSIKNEGGKEGGPALNASSLNASSSSRGSKACDIS